MLKKRIPTIIGLILLIIGAVSGVIFINQGTDFLPRAAPEYVPQKIKITNITDTSFVVSWVTKEPTIGFLRYSDSILNLSETATDDRDQLAGSSSDYRTHYITLQNLNPGATYYFKLGSQKNQLYDDNGDPFKLTLPQTLTNAKETDTAFGSVVTAVDTPAEGAIIYISLPNATPLSALVKQNGSWAVNLAMARSSDLTQAVSYDPNTTRIDLLVQTDDSDPTTAVTTTANDQPVPTITIGQTNNFVNSSAQSTPTPTPQSSTNEQNQDSPTQVSKFSLKPILVTDDTTLTITSLPNDGIISSSQPEFSGTAPANTKVTINIHSPSAQTTQVLTDQTGTWSWLVEQPLEAGDHTITISYVDSSGNVHSVEQYFVIDSTQLQQVDLSYTATPAASTPTPTPKPTPTPTPTPASAATSAAILVAGSVEPSLIMVLLGLLFVGFGAYVVVPRQK